MGKSRELVSFFEEMLSRQEYLIPMVAASFQYPIHYYGMTSAALLEDLFVDASINFRNSHKREVQISRPERASDGEEANSKGIKGWDYQFQGEHFSHKVGKGINAVALLWDATVKLPDDKRWTYESTMVYVLSNYKKPIANITSKENSKISVTSIFNYRNKHVQKGQAVFVGERLSRTTWHIHEVIELEEAENMQGAIPLDIIWEKMINYWSKSTANKFDVFVTTKSAEGKCDDLVGQAIEIDYEAHPGIYVFERERLQNIEVTQNNRAVLLPANTVGQLAKESAETGLFVFMPSWYMTYAENRPADLYLAQKQEFDQMNSASRRR
jgi:hypothetical protein